MAYIDTINYQETIRKKSIVFKSKWFDVMDTILVLMTTCFLMVCLILVFKESDLKNPNERFVSYCIVPIAMVLTLLILYKKVREKRLFLIETKLSKIEAREKIVSLVKAWQWKIHHNNADYLQATTRMEIDSWGKQVVLIYADNTIYLNVMSTSPKLRMPVLISDLTIKRDIEKELKAIS